MPITTEERARIKRVIRNFLVADENRINKWGFGAAIASMIASFPLAGLTEAYFFNGHKTEDTAGAAVVGILQVAIIATGCFFLGKYLGAKPTPNVAEVGEIKRAILQEMFESKAKLQDLITEIVQEDPIMKKKSDNDIKIMVEKVIKQLEHDFHYKVGQEKDSQETDALISPNTSLNA